MSNLTRPLKRAIPIIILPILLCVGCKTRKDVTGDPNYQRGLKRGQVYRVKVPLGLDERNSVKPLNNSSMVESVINLKGEERSKYAAKYKGIIKKGERLEISKLVYEDIPMVTIWLIPYATVLDGEFRGEVIDIYPLVKGINGTITPEKTLRLSAPNPKYLEMVK